MGKMTLHHPPHRGNLRFFAVFFTLLFAIGLTFSLSGCKALDGLELDIEDPEDGKKSGNGEKPEPGTEPAPTKPDVIEADNPSIKAKFGIQSEGTVGVGETFNTLSAYIQTGGLDDGAIKPGDWIDLEGGLTVDAYNGEGGFTVTAVDDNSRESSKRLLRLIVVGINSFNTAVENGYQPPDENNTPHVVFQFQNIPVKRRMNALVGGRETNAGGYAASEMRNYLTRVAGDGNSGKFLAGLLDAGVPEEALWAPKRFVSDKGSGTENRNTEISDLLWLPTEWELFGNGKWSVSEDETAENQAWLEYYTSDGSRIKFDVEAAKRWYYEASPATWNGVFCAVVPGGTASTYSATSSDVGCVPAFCVRGEKPGSGPEQPSSTKPAVIENAKDEPSIKVKFDIQSEGPDGVSDTFTTLHAYIQAGGLDDENNVVIRLGDWIDLEGGLQVDDAYNGTGSFTITAVDDNLRESSKRLLRLIVVGINSFNGKNGNGATPHVVFQFQNIPVTRRMNSSETNAGGYAASEMRKYLVEAGDSAADPNDGKFLAGLLDAGVPEEALWAPKRIVSVRDGQGELEDLLWLPTEREMFDKNANSVSADETEENQARLEYYDSALKRIKYLENSSAKSYWEASPSYNEVISWKNRSFCSVSMNGLTDYNYAESLYGCVPAFCVW